IAYQQEAHALEKKTSNIFREISGTTAQRQCLTSFSYLSH
ncbi:hypothetical protein Y032_0750g2036, partial [Ancylostoma ceylanicum]